MNDQTIITLQHNLIHVDATLSSRADTDKLLTDLAAFRDLVFPVAPPALPALLYDVVLLGCAEGRKLDVIRELRNAFNIPLREAKALADTPNAVVLSGVELSAAHSVRARLPAVGASVEVRPSGRDGAA